MRTLVCLLVAGLLLAGCGGSDDSASAPTSQKVTAAGANPGSAGVAASAVSVKSAGRLCDAEGRTKPKVKKAKGAKTTTKAQSPFAACVTAMKKLASGKAKSPAQACKGLSHKKTKGTRGKSPFAACVSAGASLRKSGGKLGADQGSAGSDDSADDGTSKKDKAKEAVSCTDADGAPVAVDDISAFDCVDKKGRPTDPPGFGSDDDADSSDDATDDEGGSAGSSSNDDDADASSDDDEE